MTSENLNIKIRLDLSDVTSGVKKVKAQLTGMTDKVKQSIPKISSEGKKAQSALSGVSKAGNEVKKSLDGIGDEAKSSLSDIVTQSNRAKAALKSISSVSGSDIKIGVSTGNLNTSEATEEATSSLEDMRGVMTGILGLQFWEVLSSPINDFVKSMKTSLSGMSGIGASIKETFSKSVAEVSELRHVIRVIRGNIDDVNKRLKSIASNAGVSLKTLKKQLSTEFTQGISDGIKRAEDSIVSLKGKIRSACKDMVASFQPVISKLGELGTAIGKVLLKLGALSAGLLAAAGGLIARNTKEYREAQSKLLSAYQAVGATSKEATQAYNGIYRFLGESDTAVEAANHLAKLTTNTQELAEWTTICQGIYATFGDSLRIEGLTEAANETARVGTVTGVLADALNWAGVSEEAFNEKLAKTTSLSEREALIRTTLNGLYNDAAVLYEQNNKATIAQNEAQAKLSATMGKIGQQTQGLLTSLTNLANTVMTVLAPAITYVSAVFQVLIDKLSLAIQWLGSLFGISFKTDAISGVVSGASAAIGNAVDSADALTDSLDTATGAAEKLKRTTMGFDELNIVSTTQTSGSSVSADVSATEIEVPEFSLGTNSVLSQISEETDKIKQKIEDFFEKWKTQIGIIGAALGALSLTTLLEHLGKAIGLGDKFLAAMQTVKKLAATVITITLQYTLVNEFMDNFIDGEGFKEYIKGLIVSAIGTGILYAMWGTTGLVIGLGVTAVASIKAVLDNGGITNVESLTVALTGVASAIGAISLAWTKLGIGAKIAQLVGDVGAFFALLKEGNSLSSVLAAAFPKVSNAISGIGTAASGAASIVGGFLSSIGSALGASGAGAVAAGAAVIVAAITGIASVITFLKNNWEAVTKAAQDFFALNIAPKIEELKKSWEKIVTALQSVVDAFANLGKAIWNAIPDGVKEWFSNLADEIAKLGGVFEALGSVIFTVISSVIMGAINTFISAIEGLAQIVAGVVEIVSGAVEAIVRLFSGDLKAAWDAVKKIGQGIVDVFAGLYDATIGAVIKFVEGVINWFVELWDELVGHSIVPDTIEAIVDWFWKLPTLVGEAVAKFVKDVIADFKQLWNDIKAWFTSGVAPKLTKEYWNKKFDTIRQSINDRLTAAYTTASTLWKTISGWFSGSVAPKFTIAYWTNKFDTIRMSLTTSLTAAKSAASSAWGAIGSWFNSSVAPKFTTTYWNTKFDTIKQSASERLAATKTTLQNSWNTISSWFKTSVAPKFTVSYWTDKFGVIKDGAKAAFNGLIAIVEKAFNSIIKKLNTFKISIPSWVPSVGGKKFGIDLDTISIPRLATGGVVTSSTLANIGENGREAVLPLESNTQWMDSLADKIAARNSSPTKIVLKVGERELGWATIDSINGITRQTGGLQLQLT